MDIWAAEAFDPLREGLADTWPFEAGDPICDVLASTCDVLCIAEAEPESAGGAASPSAGACGDGGAVPASSFSFSTWEAVSSGILDAEICEVLEIWIKNAFMVM